MKLYIHMYNVYNNVLVLYISNVYSTSVYNVHKSNINL